MAAKSNSMWQTALAEKPTVDPDFAGLNPSDNRWRVGVGTPRTKPSLLETSNISLPAQAATRPRPATMAEIDEPNSDAEQNHYNTYDGFQNGEPATEDATERCTMEPRTEDPEAEERPRYSEWAGEWEPEEELSQSLSTHVINDIRKQQNALRTARSPQHRQPSNQIHVFGNDVRGRFIAHTLAGCEAIPPVRVILNRPEQWWRWNKCGGRIALHQGERVTNNDRIEPEFVPLRRAHIPHAARAFMSNDPIDNLIITLPSATTLRLFGRIRHRIDATSTICLLQDAIGLADEIIDQYFPDVLERPTFLIAHLTTGLARSGKDDMSIIERRAGRLAVSVHGQESRAQSHTSGDKRGMVFHTAPRAERIVRSTHMLRLLVSVPGLHTSGSNMEQVLRMKLVRTVMKAVADPLTVMIGCPHSMIPKLPYARQLFNHLVQEICLVLTRLPEARHWDSLRNLIQSGDFYYRVYHSLFNRDRDNEMKELIDEGFESDIDFMAGYFIKRGRDVNTPCRGLESLMWAVKAKAQFNRQDLADQLPFDAESSRGKWTTRSPKQSKPRQDWVEPTLDSGIPDTGSQETSSADIGKSDTSSANMATQTLAAQIPTR